MVTRREKMKHSICKLQEQIFHLQMKLIEKDFYPGRGCCYCWGWETLLLQMFSFLLCTIRTSPGCSDGKLAKLTAPPHLDNKLMAAAAAEKCSKLCTAAGSGPIHCGLVSRTLGHSPGSQDWSHHRFTMQPGLVISVGASGCPNETEDPGFWPHL